MSLIISVSSDDDTAVEELLQEIPIDGVLAITPRHALPEDGMKSAGTLSGIVVDILPVAVAGLFKAIASVFQRPRPAPTTLTVETEDGKLSLSFDPAQLDATGMAGLVEKVTHALRAQAPPAGAKG
jgi:hypothetical protein